MQVHQMFRLVLGTLIGGGGLIILCGCFYEYLKSKTLPPHVREPALSAVLFITLGAGHLSQAFDWPHQESRRTSLIEWLSLPVIITGLALITILRRAEKKAQADQGIIAPGEHKA